jgi:ATP phosphoribosyltransferase regulatory subunit
MNETPYIAPALDRSVSLRRQVTFRAMQAFSGWGYREIQVPLIQFFDAIRRGLDTEQIEGSVRFVSRHGDVMMLRTDTTPAVANLLAFQIPHLNLPIRVSYANRVVRVGRVADLGHESYTVGVELVGLGEVLGDVEVVLVAMELLQKLGLSDFQFNVTDHGLVNEILRKTGAPLRIQRDIREAIAARDTDDVCRMLRELGIREQYQHAVAVVSSLAGGLHQLEELEAIFDREPRIQSRLRMLRRFFDTLAELGYRDRIRIDLAALSSPHYYTGIAFSIVSESVGRCVGQGGRYDNLFEEFGPSADAVGFSFFADALADVLHPRLEMGQDQGDVVTGVTVDAEDPIEGLRTVLERRRRNEPARIVEATRGDAK